MLIHDIHHVSLNVSDVDRSLEFYRDLLGLRMLERPAFSFSGAWLDAGGGRQIHLIETDHVAPDLGQHVAFQVTDLGEVIDAVRAGGHDIGDAKPVGETDIRQAFALDPDGNRVEFTQLPT